MNISFRIQACLLLVASAAASQATMSAVFQLSNVQFTNDSLNGNPWHVVRSGSGSFEWDYQAGDFSNGTGKLLTLSLPFTTYNWQSGVNTVDLNGITGSQSGNTHNTSFDFQMDFAPVLQGPNSSAHISGGNYDFTGQDTYLGGEFIGRITGGTVTPMATPEPLTLSVLGLGILGIVRRRRA